MQTPVRSKDATSSRRSKKYSLYFQVLALLLFAGGALALLSGLASVENSLGNALIIVGAIGISSGFGTLILDELSSIRHGLGSPISISPQNAKTPSPTKSSEPNTEATFQQSVDSRETDRAILAPVITNLNTDTLSQKPKDIDQKKTACFNSKNTGSQQLNLVIEPNNNPEPFVVKSGEVRSMKYRLLSNGSIEALEKESRVTFSSVDDLRRFLEQDEIADTIKSGILKDGSAHAANGTEPLISKT